MHTLFFFSIIVFHDSHIQKKRENDYLIFILKNNNLLSPGGCYFFLKKKDWMYVYLWHVFCFRGKEKSTKLNLQKIGLYVIDWRFLFHSYSTIITTTTITDFPISKIFLSWLEWMSIVYSQVVHVCVWWNSSVCDNLMNIKFHNKSCFYAEMAPHPSPQLHFFPKE